MSRWMHEQMNKKIFKTDLNLEPDGSEGLELEVFDGGQVLNVPLHLHKQIINIHKQVQSRSWYLYCMKSQEMT